MKSVAEIVGALTRGQRIAILAMSEEFCPLGRKDEPVAKRLCIEYESRPALTKQGPRLDFNVRTFALNDLGLLVRQYLVDECSHSNFRPVQKMHCYICGGCRVVLNPREAAILVAAWELFP